MKKKVIGLFLLIISFFSLVACNNDPFKKYEKLLKDGSKINLNIWTYYNNYQTTAFNLIVDEFNSTVGREKNISINHRTFNGVNELALEIEKASSKAVGALEMPNIFQSYVDDLMSLDTKYSNVASLENYFSQSDLDSFIDGILDEGRFDKDNSLKIIPVAKSTEVFMLNKTDYDEYIAKYKVSSPSFNSMEEIAQFSKIYYENTGKAFFGRDAIANMFYINSKSMNKELFSIDNETNNATLTFDEDLFKNIYDNYYVPYVNGYYDSIGKYRSDDVLNNIILSYIGSTSSAGYFPNSVIIDDDSSYQIESYVLPAQLFNGEELYSIMQGAGFAVSKSDERTEYAASVFLKYLTSPSNNINIAISLDYIPVVKDSLNFDLIKEAIIKYKLGGKEDNIENRNEINKKYSSIFKTYECIINYYSKAKMYSAKPFNNSAKVRRVFDTCIQGSKVDGMETFINADDMRNKIKQDIALGYSDEDAYNRNMEDNFEVWYNGLKDIIGKLL